MKDKTLEQQTLELLEAIGKSFDNLLDVWAGELWNDAEDEVMCVTVNRLIREWKKRLAEKEVKHA